MIPQLRPALVLLVIMTILTGIIYPFAITIAAQVVFPAQANGSLITQNGTVVGSSLIGQQFDDPKYFWGRLSATTPMAYNAAASSGSNLGPTNPALVAEVQGRVQQLHDADPDNKAPIPVDLVTSSGSGLDPNISVAAAQYQIGRVARARGMDIAKVQALVDQYTKGRTLGILGEPRVNVLALNLALDGAK